MRKNTRRAIEAREQNKSRQPSQSIWTDGESLFSYNTAILTPLPEPGPNGERFVLNVTRYSQTTTEKQNSIEAHYGPANVIKVARGDHPGREGWGDPLGRGASRDELIEAARVKIDRA